MNTASSTCRTGLQGTTMKIVMTRESVVNTWLIAYAVLTPLLVIPIAGLLGASDLLFVPAIAMVFFVGKLRGVTSHLLLAAFLILIGVSLYQTQEFEYLVKWGRLIGITFPFFLAASSTITLQQVLRFFFWSGLLAILIGIGLWWFDIAAFADEANQRIWNQNGDSRLRAAGLFGNSTAFGALIAMWTVTCGMLTAYEKRPNKFVLATVLLVAIVGLLSSTSRVSLFAIIAGIGAGATCLLATRMQRGKLRVSPSTISIGIVSVGVTAVTLWFVAPQLMDAEWLSATYSRFDPRAQSSSNSFLTGRVAIWREYLQSIDQWGAMGVGYKQGHLHFSASPHNQFLALASEAGFLCLCVFVLFVINILGNAIVHLRDKRFESMMCIAVMSTFLADSMGGAPLGTWQVTPVTMLLMGICVREFSQQKSTAIDCPIPDRLHAGSRAAA